MKTLTGQVAIVTGAGRGIGRAMAVALAESGARVALAARSAPEIESAAAAIQAAGGTAVPLVCDVSEPDSVQDLIASASSQLGPLDLLVNNAGSFQAIGPVWEVEPESWWMDVTTNLRGVFLCCRAVLPGMLERDAGRILNVIGGGAGNPFPYGSGYASSKAGVMRLTECLAAELREAGARVVAFALGPGLVRTAMTEHQLQSPAGRQWMPRIRTMFAEGRDVPPERAASLVVALAGGAFDRLSGRLLTVGDDLEAVLKGQEEILRKDRKTLRFR